MRRECWRLLLFLLLFEPFVLALLCLALADPRDAVCHQCPRKKSNLPEWKKKSKIKSTGTHRRKASEIHEIRENPPARCGSQLLLNTRQHFDAQVSLQQFTIFYIHLRRNYYSQLKTFYRGFGQLSNALY